MTYTQKSSSCFQTTPWRALGRTSGPLPALSFHGGVSFVAATPSASWKLSPLPLPQCRTIPCLHIGVTAHLLDHCPRALLLCLRILQLQKNASFSHEQPNSRYYFSPYSDISFLPTSFPVLSSVSYVCWEESCKRICCSRARWDSQPYVWITGKDHFYMLEKSQTSASN